jgi:hypothetical protein
MMKKMMKKSMSMFSCVLIYLVGVLTADLVSPMIEKVPVLGDLFGKAEDMIANKSDESEEGEA